MWHRIGRLVILTGLGCTPVFGSLNQATVGFEYDDNMFSSVESRQAGWVSRLFLSTGGRIVDRSTAAVGVQHRCGVRRYWQRAANTNRAGDVVANHLEIRGQWWPTTRLAWDWELDAKLKNVERVPGEESYLRGGGKVGLTRFLPRGVTATIDLREARDEARDSLMVDLRHRELGMELGWRRSRRLTAQAGIRRHALAYDRAVVLAAQDAGGWSTGAATQEDRLWEYAIGLRYYTRLLARFRYAYHHNSSNSYGYAYTAHRIQLTLARHLWRQVDSYLFMVFQLRDYIDTLTGPTPVEYRTQNEYEQALVVLRLHRQLSENYGLSYRYRSVRSGTVGTGQRYRQTVNSISFDMVM